MPKAARQAAQLARPVLAVVVTSSAIAILAIGSLPSSAANTNVDVTARTRVVGCEDAPYDYSPRSVTIAAGDTVTFRNPSSHAAGCAAAPHPTRCAPGTSQGSTKGDCPFTNFPLDPGTSHSQPFPANGTFRLQCLVHPYMLMAVVVGDGEPPAPPTQPEPITDPEPQPDPTRIQPVPGRTPPPGQAPSESSPTPRSTPGPTDTATAVTADEPTSSPTPSPQPEATETSSTSGRGPVRALAMALVAAAVAGQVAVRRG